MVDDFISYGESLGAMFKFIANPQSNDKDQFGERTSAIQNELAARISPNVLTKAMKKHAFRIRWFWLFVTPTKKKI